MREPQIINIHYSEEMPRESTILIYRIIEIMIIESLPYDPHLIGLFL